MPSKCKLIIDIGSNSIKFLTIKGKQILNKGKTDTGLYGMIVGHSTTKHIIGRITQLIEDTIKSNTIYRPDEIFIYATETVRQFEDKEQLIQCIQDKFNVTLKILSAKEEAEFSYKVACRKFADEKDVIVIDLGGASTEISLGLNNKHVYAVSLPVGGHNIGKASQLKLNIPELLGPVFKEINRRREYTEKPLKFILMGGMIECLTRLESIISDEDYEYFDLNSFEHYFIVNKENLTEYRQEAVANGVMILNYILQGITPNIIWVSREDLRFYFI